MIHLYGIRSKKSAQLLGKRGSGGASPTQGSFMAVTKWQGQSDRSPLADAIDHATIYHRMW